MLNLHWVSFVICVFSVLFDHPVQCMHTPSSALWLIAQSKTIEAHGTLISMLKDNDYELSIYENLSEVPPLFDHLQLAVSNIILFGNKLPHHWKLGELLDYVSQGGNLLYIHEPRSLQEAETSQTTALDTFLGQLGIVTIPFPVVDYYHTYREKSISNPLYSTREVGTAGQTILGASVVRALQSGTPLLYSSAYGLKLDKERSKCYLWSSISPEISAVCMDLQNNKIMSTGDELSLIASFQSKVNSRVTVVASNDLLSDPLLNNPLISNKAVIQELIHWTFLRKGVLKIQALDYFSENQRWVANETETPKKMIRVLDNIYVFASLSEWSHQTQTWIPFLADDVQVELIMLSPLVRLTLKPCTYESIRTNVTDVFGYDVIPTAALSTTAQLYYGSSVLPDRVGLYTFSLNYRRQGLTALHQKNFVIVRQYAHNEYPKHQRISFPYYLVMISMMIGTLLLALVCLYHKEEEGEKAKQL